MFHHHCTLYYKCQHYCIFTSNITAQVTRSSGTILYLLVPSDVSICMVNLVGGLDWWLQSWYKLSHSQPWWACGVYFTCMEQGKESQSLYHPVFRSTEVFLRTYLFICNAAHRKLEPYIAIWYSWSVCVWVYRIGQVLFTREEKAI